MTRPRWVGALVVGLAALAGACAGPPPLTAPVGLMPDLRGTWTGTWGGTPLTLVVLEQQDAGPVDGVSVGPWQVLGRELPAVAGILSVKMRSEMVSVNVRGRLGTLHGRLTLVLEPATVNGGWITLTRLDENRLAGTGRAQMSWEPQGSVELIRQLPGPPANPPA
ncbi:MAG: hypothetical protein ACRELZ_11570 [Candidatus Rokuibacteriota bacterium]